MLAAAQETAALAQQQLGDDDEREARQLALQRDVETRLAALGSGGIKKPKDTAVAGRGCSVYHCISPYYLTPRGRPSGIMYNTY